MAVLDRHGIPGSLLRKDGEREAEFVTSLGTLKAFSLIIEEKGGETFEMHQLVQLATHNWLQQQDTEKRYQNEALEALSKKFPSGEYANWKVCEALSPHALVALEYRMIAAGCGVRSCSTMSLSTSGSVGVMGWRANTRRRHVMRNGNYVVRMTQKHYAA
jgi:hypothetical protein